MLRALPWLAPLAVLATACGPTYPSCDHDHQCHEGEHCVNGRCQDCRDDSDCAAGKRCASGACERIPGWCATDSDCPSSEECVESTCRPRRLGGCDLPVPAPTECQLAAAYFALDDARLDDAARNALEQDLRCMGERSIAAVMITGMADPRGTEEYNLALGDRRARASRDHLVRLGVARRAVITRTVGEEQSTGSDEHGWSRDRRAEVTERR